MATKAKKAKAEGVSVFGSVGTSSFQVQNVETIVYTKDEGFVVTTEDGLTVSADAESAFSTEMFKDE